MGIRMSIARCCCVPAGCSTPTCQYDEFDTYGTGNSVLSNSFYDSVIGTGVGSTSATQTASEQLKLSAGTSSNAELWFKLGVSGGNDSPDFETAYADKTVLEVEVKDVESTNHKVSLGFLPEGDIAGVDYPRIFISTGYVNSTTHRKRVRWTDVDNSVQTADLTFSSPANTDYYKHTYAIELYDYQQQTGSDSVSRATFEWKIVESGSVLFESHDGTSRLYSRFGAALPTDVAYDWCSSPRGRLTVSGFNHISFGTNIAYFDNLSVNVNGDDSCVP